MSKRRGIYFSNGCESPITGPTEMLEIPIDKRTPARNTIVREAKIVIAVIKSETFQPLNIQINLTQARLDNKWKILPEICVYIGVVSTSRSILNRKMTHTQRIKIN